MHKYLSKTRKSLTRHLFHQKIDTTSNIVRISIRHKRRIKTTNNETKQIEFQFKKLKSKKINITKPSEKFKYLFYRYYEIYFVYKN